MGVTVGWIDEDTLERKWQVVACKRVRGKHSYDVLGHTLIGIMKEANMEQNFKAFVTDGAKNLSKMFRYV
jgi:hypothetical protein